MSSIRFYNDCDLEISYDIDKLKKIILYIFNEEKSKLDEISVIFVNRNKLSKLKKEYFNKDQYTDVMVFNLENENSPIEGEVYISIDDVRLNSKEYNVTFNKEFKRVLIHGILHLIGYNDDSKIAKQKMTKLEDKYLQEYELEVIRIGR
tara:strand:+ start:792 stop:1238 length:447 start_codon:yes stop_codon:yes gene_type:complete